MVLLFIKFFSIYIYYTYNFYSWGLSTEIMCKLFLARSTVSRTVRDMYHRFLIRIILSSRNVLLENSVYMFISCC